MIGQLAPAPPLVLTGIRAARFADTVMGTNGGMKLDDHGADAIKIAPISRDSIRTPLDSSGQFFCEVHSQQHKTMRPLSRGRKASKHAIA